ncbi:MAG: 2-phosphosulfolactate phosphatase, partial [Firmicutes bacterium]|nr:2-phosphosulfolactate phosphatase [Bacillota bacterium]
MNIQVLHLLEGAKAARGLTVIIDVFRAFSLECYLYAFGAREVRPVGAIEEALSFRGLVAGRAVPTDAVTPAGRKECELSNVAQTGQTLNDVVLIGERGGVKLPGFDYG